MKRFIIYSRRSKVTKGSRTHMTGEWEVKQYLQMLDAQGVAYEIVDHVEEDFSGYGYYTKRPLFSKIVARCKEDKSLTLLASKPDRIARDSWSGAELLKTINMVVANYHDAEDMTLQIMFSIAEKEVKSTSDRYKAAYQAKKEECLRENKPLIWGGNSAKWRTTFDKNASEGNHKNSKSIEKSRQAAQPMVERVKEIITLFNDKLTLAELADKLNSVNITTPTGKQWSRAGMSGFVRRYDIKYNNKHKYSN